MRRCTSHFNGTRSIETITQYIWNFGDATTSNQEIANHTFPATVTIELSDTNKNVQALLQAIYHLFLFNDNQSKPTEPTVQ